MSKVLENLTETVKIIIEEAKNSSLMPWDSGLMNGNFRPINPITGTKYKGWNRLFLSYMTKLRGGENATYEYVTFNNVAGKKERVHKGAKSLKIVFWNTNPWNKVQKRKPKDGDDPKEIVNVPFLKEFSVFEITDTTMAPTRKVKHRDEVNRRTEIDDFVQKFVNKTGVSLETKKVSGTAYYQPSKHLVSIAGQKYYRSDEEYYSTLFHELVHSTARACGRKSEEEHLSYSQEEVVAETGAMLLCHYFGIEKAVRENSKTYVLGWAKSLMDNPTWLVNGMNHAEKAVEFMLETAGFPLEDGASDSVTTA